MPKLIDSRRFKVHTADTFTKKIHAALTGDNDDDEIVHYTSSNGV
jgi:hypothetical protein